MERTKVAAMPRWVKVGIAAGVVAVLAVLALTLAGHGPWQHGAMAGMHG